jgi:hypothetical protein
MVINYPQHYYPKSGTKLTRPKAGEEVTRWVGGEGRRGGVINCASCVILFVIFVCGSCVICVWFMCGLCVVYVWFVLCGLCAHCLSEDDEGSVGKSMKMIITNNVT